MSLRTYSLAGAVGLLLAACNTMEGMGEDIETTGDVIQDSAKETKQDMPRKDTNPNY